MPEGDNFTHAQTRPFEPIDPYICMLGGIADVINCAKLFENPSKGFGAVRPQKTAFSIDFVHRPYNILAAILSFENAKRKKISTPDGFLNYTI